MTNAPSGTSNTTSLNVTIAGAGVVSYMRDKLRWDVLFVLEHGNARFWTEFGIIETVFGDVVVIPRGLKFRVELLTPQASGLIAENYGLALRLPIVAVS